MVLQKKIRIDIGLSKQTRFFCLMLFLLVFASCGYRELKNTAPEVNTIHVNENFTINLPEIHSDGYNWMLSNDFNSSMVEKTASVWKGKEKGIDFSFKTLAAGQTTLTFVKRKYIDTAAIQQYIVQIIDK